MAANSKCRGITSLGKRVANQIWTHNSPLRTHALPSSSSSSALALRRATYTSLYEKNLDDQVCPAVVPDYVIQAAHSDKYWAPHPQTGVFGPPTDHITATATATVGSHNRSTPAAADASAASVLEEKAWFRPTSLEDLEKPHHLA
ncbi:late embryogenesis abundant protein At5g17165-like [Prosopis cineraria]|uniref:late embryogenesis abundant protein At5g17165-like n=1 Tax=Prosopis cineraria TaxID=364024 RepID=UPI0024103377|nr:late embryogenesis abundant protein At5g17165-like [Prosopis cineraria]